MNVCLGLMSKPYLCSMILRSPSNIAIIKYWGKYGRQLPRNPSISFTLSEAYTETELTYARREKEGGIWLDFWFEGKENLPFKSKLVKFLDSVSEFFPFLAQYQLEVRSSNTFPHSAGIASSASAMSAMALCLCNMERELMGTLSKEEDFLKKASMIARLGSGSACRSVYPVMAVWGETPAMPGASNEYAVPFMPHDIFKTFHDDILIIRKKEKKVSSTAGHGLMDGNPYAPVRYAQANARLEALLPILRAGDVEAFGTIAEDEALTLHALMMTSAPSYLLTEPETLSAINAVRTFREETQTPLYFTLDAGPNLHLLYPHEAAGKVDTFVKEVLVGFCEDGQVVRDRVG